MEKLNFYLIFKKIFLFLSGFFVGIFVFYFLSLSQKEKLIQSITQQTSEKVFWETKKLDYQLLIKNANLPKEPEDIFLIQGRIKDIDSSNNFLTIIVDEPFDPINYLFKDSQNFKVIIDNQTEIIKLIPEDSEKLSKALFEYNKAIQEKREPPPMPAPYLRNRVFLSDLKPGEKVKIKFRGSVKFKGEGVAGNIEAWDF